MNVNKTAFCALSGSYAWQQWLRAYDETLYTVFLERLIKNKSCGSNKNLMDEMFNIISERDGGTAALYEFLDKNYPHLIIEKTSFEESIKNRLDKLFGANILTFPRRAIIAEDDFNSFIKNVREGLYLSIDGRIYIEYLAEGDASLFMPGEEIRYVLSKYNLCRRINNGKAHGS